MGVFDFFVDSFRKIGKSRKKNLKKSFEKQVKI